MTVLPVQAPAMNTVKQASNPFGLVVAPDALGKAAGSLFLDDGATLQVGSNSPSLVGYFCLLERPLTYALQANGSAPASALRFNDVNVLGCSVAPTAAIADGQAVNVTYEADTQVATADLNLPLNAPFSLSRSKET